MVDISSVSNQRVKSAVKLRDNARERRETGLFFLEGLRLCRDAVRNGISAKTVFYTEQFESEHNEAYLEITATANEKFSVSNEVMKKLSDTVNPQGIIILCEIPQFSKELQNGLYIGLENSADPSNLGAIARSAEAFGAKGILVSATSCDPYSPKSLRAGMGALLRLPIIVCKNFLSEMQALKSSGITLYASVVDKNAKDIREVVPEKTSVLLIGNEASGLTSELIEISERVTIPMAGRGESLNAAAAATVLIWELSRGNA